MTRDAMTEWQRATRRRASYEPMRNMPVHVPATPVLCGPALEAPAIRRTRRLQARDWRQDLGQAIRLLQRHNRLIRERFGVGWADATTVVQGEAARRGMPASALARLLVSGLRQDAAEGMA